MGEYVLTVQYLTPLLDISTADVGGKRVLLRAELNVPFAPDTTDIADDSRIRATLPTLELLRKSNARTIVCTHIGRPRGKWVDELTVEPVRRRMADLLGCDVRNAGLVGSDHCRDVVDALQPGDVAILENLRFRLGEEGNEPSFVNALADLADIYVNDAFGASHRAHASIVGVPATVRERYAGLLLASENNALTEALQPSDGVSVAAVGGAKVADKLALIRSLAVRFDWVLAGGGMVKAFVDGRMYPESPPNEEAALALSLWQDEELRPKIVMPTHVKITSQFSPDAEFHGVDAANAHGPGKFILDIDGAAILEYKHLLEDASKIVWNGPMGVFEWPRFSGGTKAVAETIAANTTAFTLAGGGSTAEAISKFGLDGKLTHVSTGGGAALEFLEGKSLPGIAALTNER